jgi:hypothetical protein
MKNSQSLNVYFPASGETRRFRSITAVARMLSGNGTASGSMRTRIAEAANTAGEVRNVQVWA